MNAHAFHKLVGDKLKSKFDGVLLDSACGGDHTLPLFYGTKKSWGTKFCNPDIIIIKNEQIKILIEIEESNIKPHQVCGKLLTSALATHYIYQEDTIEMNEKVLFIQILDHSKIKGNARKDQRTNLEKAICNILPVKGSKITDYKIMAGHIANFNFEQLFQCIQDFL